MHGHRLLKILIMDWRNSIGHGSTLRKPLWPDSDTTIYHYQASRQPRNMIKCVCKVVILPYRQLPEYLQFDFRAGRPCVMLLAKLEQNIVPSIPLCTTRMHEYCGAITS